MFLIDCIINNFFVFSNNRDKTGSGRWCGNRLFFFLSKKDHTANKKLIEIPKKKYSQIMNLPYEIFLQIFNSLPKSAIKKCAIACKSWSLPAFQVYYKEVTMKDHNTKNLKALFDQEGCFKYCYLVEKVSFIQARFGIADECKLILTKQEFLKFFKCMPNLKEIKIHTRNSKSEYSEYLLDTDISQQLTRLESINFETDGFNYNPDDVYNSVW